MISPMTHMGIETMSAGFSPSDVISYYRLEWLLTYFTLYISSLRFDL